MNCPVCAKEMVQENFGIKAYVCRNGCRGMWFDHGELQKIDQNNEAVAEAFKAALNYPRVNDKNRGPLTCPKCHTPMHPHKYERDQEVNVDECYGCGGFFLDSGELSDIRNAAMSDSDVETYVDKLIENIPAYKNAKAQEERIKAAQNLGQLLKAFYWEK